MNGFLTDMNRIESAIQAALILWVKETYPTVIITATANERSYKETKQIGCLGITDLLLFHSDGGALFLELKQKKGKLQPSQMDFNRMFDAWHPDNFSRDVAYGYIHAQEIIIKWLS